MVHVIFCITRMRCQKLDDKKKLKIVVSLMQLWTIYIYASQVFAWGYNNYGQCGLGSTSNISTPTKITSVLSEFLLQNNSQCLQNSKLHFPSLDWCQTVGKTSLSCKIIFHFVLLCLIAFYLLGRTCLTGIL